MFKHRRVSFLQKTGVEIFQFFMQKSSKTQKSRTFWVVFLWFCGCSVLWFSVGGFSVGGCSGNCITAHRMKPKTEKIKITLAHTVRIIFKTPPAKYLKRGGLNIIQAVFFTVIRLLGYSVCGCSVEGLRLFGKLLFR
ncbi:MAG: hypothetical protein IKD25_04525 [Bacteroidaceae bacterium]|nr:hypothetical protein [Bacteroidaceae bacterium]